MNKEITAETILALLPIVAHKNWEVGANGSIRVAGAYGEYFICPVCAMVNEIIGEEKYSMAANVAMTKLFGVDYIDHLSCTELCKVTDAADFEYEPLRPALMAALGMTP